MRANTLWTLPNEGSVCTDQAQLAVLMDIRHELQVLNRVMRCHNTQRIPRILDKIAEAVSRTDKRLAAKSPIRKGKRK